MNTYTEPIFTRVTGDNAPAVRNPGWLPDLETFPELVEARSEYLRLWECRSVAYRRVRELQDRLDSEKERSETALKDAYLAGQPAEMGSEDEALARELGEARSQAQAAASAWLEHINRTIALVIERRHEWFAFIDERQGEIDAEIQELVSRANRLRIERGDFSRFEHWAERTGGRVRPNGVTSSGPELPGSHFPYSDIGRPPSGVPAEEEERLMETFLKSFAGWDSRNLPLSDEQATELERRNEEARQLAPEASAPVVELDDDDLVDWLMGCGAFDGQPRPGPDLVIAAVEENPELAERMLKAERTANEASPRPDVISRLERII